MPMESSPFEQLIFGLDDGFVNRGKGLFGQKFGQGLFSNKIPLFGVNQGIGYYGRMSNPFYLSSLHGTLTPLTSTNVGILASFQENPVQFFNGCYEYLKWVYRDLTYTTSTGIIDKYFASSIEKIQHKLLYILLLSILPQVISPFLPFLNITMGIYPYQWYIFVGLFGVLHSMSMIIEIRRCTTKKLRGYKYSFFSALHLRSSLVCHLVFKHHGMGSCYDYVFLLLGDVFGYTFLLNLMVFITRLQIHGDPNEVKQHLSEDFQSINPRFNRGIICEIIKKQHST